MISLPLFLAAAVALNYGNPPIVPARMSFDLGRGYVGEPVSLWVLFNAASYPTNAQYYLEIDWGDGSPLQRRDGTGTIASHVYTNYGRFSVGVFAYNGVDPYVHGNNWKDIPIFARATNAPVFHIPQNPGADITLGAATPGAVYRIDTTTDGVTWQEYLQRQADLFGFITFPGILDTAPMRFYRAASPP